MVIRKKVQLFAFLFLFCLKLRVFYSGEREDAQVETDRDQVEKNPVEGGDGNEGGPLTSESGQQQPDAAVLVHKEQNVVNKKGKLM